MGLPNALDVDEELVRDVLEYLQQSENNAGCRYDIRALATAFGFKIDSGSVLVVRPSCFWSVKSDILCFVCRNSKKNMEYTYLLKFISKPSKKYHHIARHINTLFISTINTCKYTE